MPSINRILFPVDFSPACQAVARHVEFFAGRFQAEVMLLHAVGMGEHALAEELLPNRQAQLNAFLADEFKYFTTQRLCVTSDPATAIVTAVDQWQPDLVMMPTHGMGAFRRLLLGSVTAKALHDLDRPIWTSAHLETPPALEAIHCRRILCAVDLSERSKCVLAWASQLAGEFEAQLGIVHATAELPSEYYGWNLEDEYAEAIAAEAKKGIDALQKEAGTDVPVIIVPGYPSSVIAQAAKDFSADLLIAGRHNDRGLSGYLHQNGYAILRDAPCPVISI